MRLSTMLRLRMLLIYFMNNPGENLLLFRRIRHFRVCLTDLAW